MDVNTAIGYLVCLLFLQGECQGAPLSAVNDPALYDLDTTDDEYPVLDLIAWGQR